MDKKMQASSLTSHSEAETERRRDVRRVWPGALTGTWHTAVSKRQRDAEEGSEASFKQEKNASQSEFFLR